MFNDFERNHWDIVDYNKMKNHRIKMRRKESEIKHIQKIKGERADH